MAIDKMCVKFSLFAVLLFFQRMPFLTAMYNIKVGLMAPVGLTEFNPTIGFGTSMGAVGMAIDSIKRDQLLTTVNITWLSRMGQCAEARAANASIDYYYNEKIDVLIGPACSISAVIAGIIGANFITPLIGWSTIDPQLGDRSRFPTFARAISSATSIGVAFRDLLDYFGWKKIALLTTNDGQRMKCLYAKQGFLDSISDRDFSLQVMMEIDTKSTAPISNDHYDKFWSQASTKARIIVTCLDNVPDRRNFMLHAYNHGYVNDEFVFVFAEFLPDNNQTEYWKDYSSQPDGQDDIARVAFEKSLIIEFDLADLATVQKFRGDIMQRITQDPFYYKLGPLDLFGSTYSPFLHDAIYLYAMALNATIKQGYDPRNGTAVFNNCKGISFNGISGNVAIDNNAERKPVYVVRGFDISHQYVPFAKLEPTKTSGTAISLLVAGESKIWALRGGARPPDTPICGFSGKQCPTSKSEIIGISVGCSGVVVAAAICVGIYFIRKNRQSNKNCSSLWRLDYHSFIELPSSSTNTSGTAASKSTMSSATEHISLTKVANHMSENAKLMFHKGNLTWLRMYEARGMVLTHNPDHIEFRQMRAFNHDNINPFLGICVDMPNTVIAAWKFCPKLSLQEAYQLQEVFKHEHMKLDWYFKYSLIKDLADGMSFLHDSPLKSHGRLKSSNCLVDARWTLKISDYGLSKMRKITDQADDDLLWTAPEILRLDYQPAFGTPEGDVYSFAVVLQEIVTECRPYQTPEEYDSLNTTKRILNHLRVVRDPPYRPHINVSVEDGVDQRIFNLIKQCWAEQPISRADFKMIKTFLKGMGKGREINVMDHVLSMMEKYAETLEQTVNERTLQLEEEKKRCDLLLFRLLPQVVAEKLKSGQELEPEQYDAVTVFFSDVVGFTVLSSKSTPMQVVTMLNDLYTLFDGTIAEHDVYKVETIGDGYMCVSGLPHRNGEKHVTEIADMALKLTEKIKTFRIRHLPEEKLQLRIGLCSGPCVAGVVGLSMPRYCLFGDTVNTASRMESHGKPGLIHTTESTYLLLKTAGYLTESRGEVMIKGKGMMTTYFLLGRPQSDNFMKDQVIPGMYQESKAD